MISKKLFFIVLFTLLIWGIGYTIGNWYIENKNSYKPPEFTPIETINNHINPKLIKETESKLEVLADLEITSNYQREILEEDKISYKFWEASEENTRPLTSIVITTQRERLLLKNRNLNPVLQKISDADAIHLFAVQKRYSDALISTLKELNNIRLDEALIRINEGYPEFDFTQIENPNLREQYKLIIEAEKIDPLNLSVRLSVDLKDHMSLFKEGKIYSIHNKFLPNYLEHRDYFNKHRNLFIANLLGHVSNIGLINPSQLSEMISQLETN